MSNKRKTILLLLTVIILAGAGMGYYLYNKQGIDVQNADGEKVFAKDLYQTFTKDSIAAKKNYTNKILEVSGTVTLLSENQQHQQIVMLKTNADGAAINCTMEGKQGDIKTGQPVSIKGICNGIGEGDADLGIMGDVYLVRCYILK